MKDSKGTTSPCNPLVSVSLGTYNGEKYLAEQLDSILQQTYPNIEIVITDDCSTDATQQILKNYAEKYNNIKVYFNEKNLGYLRNFEKNLHYTTGEFIAFSDQDDIWLPDKIQILIDSIGDYPLVYSDTAYVDAEGKPMGKKLSDVRNFISGVNLYATEPSGGSWVAGHTMLFKRKLLETALPFPDYFNHDAWMSYIAMLNGGIKPVNKPLVLYRQHGNNAIGGVGRGKKVKKSSQRKKPQYNENEKFVGEVNALLSRCPDTEPEFKLFLTQIRNYSSNPTFANRIRRMLLRLKYLNKIYAPRKRNTFRRAFKVLKLF